MSKVFKIEEARKVRSPEKRTTSRLVDAEMGATRMTVVLFEYDPNANPRKVHYHERRESAYIILEGRATLLLNGEEHILEPNTVAYLSPGDTHGIVDISEKGLKLIEIWSPMERDVINVE